jgi:hypothetical protein
MNPNEIETLRSNSGKLYLRGVFLLHEMGKLPMSKVLQETIDKMDVFMPVCNQANEALSLFSATVTESDLGIFVGAVKLAEKFFGDLDSNIFEE